MFAFPGDGIVGLYPQGLGLSLLQLSSLLPGFRSISSWSLGT